MPITIRLAHNYRVSPSKMLIPLSYAAILGGTDTSWYVYQPTSKFHLHEL